MILGEQADPGGLLEARGYSAGNQLGGYTRHAPHVWAVLNSMCAWFESGVRDHKQPAKVMPRAGPGWRHNSRQRRLVEQDGPKLRALPLPARLVAAAVGLAALAGVVSAAGAVCASRCAARCSQQQWAGKFGCGTASNVPQHRTRIPASLSQRAAMEGVMHTSPSLRPSELRRLRVEASVPHPLQWPQEGRPAVAQCIIAQWGRRNAPGRLHLYHPRGVEPQA